jgi:glycerol-3-phosphate dehydrogenase (NAD(P)+)
MGTSVECAGVLGAGSWGTALAIHLLSAGLEVRLWARREELAESLRKERENVPYLPGVALPESLEITADLSAMSECQLVLVVVPSHGFRSIVGRFLQCGVQPNLTLVSATKGIESVSLARMSQVAAEEASKAGTEINYAVLSGPTFAAELARGAPSAAVIASQEGELAADLRERLSTSSFRLYSSTDVVGVELGGAGKNVIAIGAGVVSGLGLGYNTQAALMTRGLHEIVRLGAEFGGVRRTFAGLAGLGDLVLTCTGGLSRNRQTGIDLAEGKTLEEIRAGTSMVAEGILNSRSLTRLARSHEVEMPITEQMMAILYEGKAPRDAVMDLMTRELKEEAQL